MNGMSRVYRQSFSIDSLPFLTTPQIDYFQPMHDHALAVNTVVYALSQGDAFIQVTGEVGVGKTMTLRYIADKIKDQYTVCYIPNGQMSTSGLISHIIHELSDSPPEPKFGSSYQLEDIHHWLIQHYTDGLRVVVLVDEAQTFSSHSLELLRLITNLETRDVKLMQIVLFGQPELKKKLSQPHLRQLAQRIHYRLHIGSPSQADLQQYLMDRLVCSGHRHGLIFSSKAVKALHVQAQGILRLVNIISHKAMLSAFSSKRDYVVESDILHAAYETKGMSCMSLRERVVNYLYIR